MTACPRCSPATERPDDAYGHGLVPCARAARAGGAHVAGGGPAGRGPAPAGGRRSPPRCWPGCTCPGDDSRRRRGGRRRPVGECRLGGRRDRRRRARGRATGPAAPQDRHRPVRAAVPRRGDWAGAGRARAGGAGRAALQVVGLWSHLAWADAPGAPDHRRQIEAFDEALARRGAAGCAARGAAPGELGGHADPPGRPLRHGAAGPRRLRAVAGARTSAGPPRSACGRR